MLDHETEGLDCWCGPRYAKPCFECERPGPCPFSCINGYSYVTREEAASLDAGEYVYVVIHNAAEGE